MRFFYRFLSLIFHPVFIPVYMVLLVLSLPVLEILLLNLLLRTMIVGLLLVNNVIIPLFAVQILKSQGLVKSFSMESRAERNIPYMLNVVLYAITTYMLGRTGYIDKSLVLVPFLALIISLLLYIFNRYIKISAHLAALGSLTAFILLLRFYYEIDMVSPFIFAVLISGLVGSARLYLQAHRPKEIWLGFALGFFVSLITGALLLF